MSNKVFFVVQGHTHHLDKLLENYKSVENVIWATDSSTDENTLERIRNSNITLVTKENPPEAGYGNINLQVGTTIAGILKAKEMGATHVIKVRSDLIFKDPARFVREYTFDDRLHFLAYCKHGDWCDKNIVDIYPELIDYIKERNYQEEVSNFCDYNYVADFSNLGLVDEMLLFWDFPYEASPLRTPAEFKLTLRYFREKGLKNVDFDLEKLSPIFGFYIGFCNKTNNPMTSLKRGWTTDDLYSGPGWRG
jgi:hypothetical protein